MGCAISSRILAIALGSTVLLAGCGGGGGGGGGGGPPGADTTPAAFAFVDQTGVATGSVITSAPVTITGIDAAAPVTVAGGSYSVGCTATYATAAGTIDNGQTVCVRHVAAAAAGTATNTTLTVGGVADVFTSTTAAAGAAAASLLPFLAANGDVRLLDPTLATGAGNPVTVDTGLAPPTAGVVCNDCFDRAEAFYTGTVAGSTLSGLRAARLAYVKGGQVFRVNLTKGAANAPVQISSVDDACRIVRTETTDLTDIDNTAVVIERAGDDSCATAADNVVTVIRLGSAATDAGLDIPLALGAGNPLHARTDASGAVTGYVSFEITDTDPLLVQLVSRDASLGAPAVLKTLESSLGVDLSGANLERAGLTRLFVTATPRDLGLTLFRVESGGGLSAALHTFAGYNDGNPIQDGVHDAAALYFSDENRLLSIALGATTESADVVATLPCASAETCLRIEHRALDAGTDRVVFEAHDENITVAGGVFSAATDGSTPAATPLASNPEPSGLGGFAVLHTVTSGRAYINLAYHDTPTNSVDALRIETDGGNPATTTSAYWAGSNRATTGQTGAPPATAMMFLATRVGQQAGDGTDTLFAVDAASGVTGAQLGVIDDASVFLSLNINGVGRYALARVEKRRDDGTLDYDTYAVDGEAAGSLAPLAVAPAATDIPLDSLQRLTGNLCLVCL